MTKQQWTHEERARLITMLASGKKVKEVAAMLGRNPQNVHAYMNKTKISRGAIRRAAENARREVLQEAEALRLSVSPEELAEFMPEDV